jgi:polysaccharide biosynthesis/export protein
MRKHLSSLCLLAGMCVIGVRAADQARPPKELLEFVQQARALGLADPEIKKSAVIAGWKPAVVEQAVSKSRGGSEGSSASVKDRGVPDTYRIGPGDVLQVTVWKEPDASLPQVTVRNDGKISMPLIKEVDVVGLTPLELEKVLAEKVSKFINATEVTVSVREVHSKKIYIVGAVKKEGPVPLNSPMTVLQAIVEAGGLNDYAKRKKIYILRNQDGKQVKLPFDYVAVIKGERMDQNIMVMSDDTIVVPQ